MGDSKSLVAGGVRFQISGSELRARAADEISELMDVDLEMTAGNLASDPQVAIVSHGVDYWHTLISFSQEDIIALTIPEYKPWLTSQCGH